MATGEGRELLQVVHGGEEGKDVRLADAGRTASPFTGDGSTDLKGRPADKLKTGGWRTCFFIYGNEMADRLSYFAIVSNLVTYLTVELHEGLAQASTNVNNWQGTLFILSVLGAFTADAWLGRFYSIAGFGFINLIGLVLLTLAVTVDKLKPPRCAPQVAPTACPRSSAAQLAFFFGALYVTALGSGGTKSCVSSFGADQFDEEDDKESLQKKSFFNWWYMLLAVGVLLAVTVVVYIQENVSWGWGFGVQTAAFGFAMLVFFLGTPYYRHQPVTGSAFTQLSQVLVAAARKWRTPLPSDSDQLYQGWDAKSLAPGRRQMFHTNSYLFLDKAATITGPEKQARTSPWRLCTVTQVEELKLFIRMVPIWISNLIFQATMAQIFTLFTRQGSTMDTHLGSSFKIPPASFQIFSTFAILITIPIYDRLFVPAARKLTGNPRGITLLQRMGTGYILAVLSMICAALTESHRLRYVRTHHLEDSPERMLPLTVFWLLPQYFVIGVADAFTLVASLEFFYIEAPDHMRTVGSALNLTANGVGSFLSSALITLTNRVTSQGGRAPWVGSNINSSQLDNFYWLVAVLGMFNLLYFFIVAARYKYKQTSK